jgi:hypothetical protein
MITAHPIKSVLFSSLDVGDTFFFMDDEIEYVCIKIRPVVLPNSSLTSPRYSAVDLTNGYLTVIPEVAAVRPFNATLTYN